MSSLVQPPFAGLHRVIRPRPTGQQKCPFVRRFKIVGRSSLPQKQQQQLASVAWLLSYKTAAARLSCLSVGPCVYVHRKLHLLLLLCICYILLLLLLCYEALPPFSSSYWYVPSTFPVTRKNVAIFCRIFSALAPFNACRHLGLYYEGLEWNSLSIWVSYNFL